MNGSPEAVSKLGTRIQNSEVRKIIMMNIKKKVFQLSMVTTLFMTTMKFAEFHEHVQVVNSIKLKNGEAIMAQFQEQLKLMNQVNYDLRKELEEDFSKLQEELDRKHNFKREDLDVDPMTGDEHIQRLEDLSTTREQDDIENIHENIFEGGHFSIAKFNEAFDKKHGARLDVIQHTGNPMAWDNMSGMEFGNIDDYEQVYVEDDATGNKLFAPLKTLNTQATKITKSEVDKLHGASYVSGHNSDRDGDYTSSLEKKMQERQLESDNLIKNRQLSDFNTDPDMGGYGIFTKVGITGKEIMWNDAENMGNKYKKLLEIRNQPVQSPSEDK